MTIYHTFSSSKRPCTAAGAFFRFVVLALGLWGVSSPALVSAQATDGMDLYAVTVPLQEQSEEQLQEAQRKAMAKVLVKVSGNRSVLKAAAVKKAMAKAGRWVEQYHYVASEEDPAAVAGLWVRFDQAAIEGLLRDSGLPVWGHTRPVTLAWVVQQTDGRRRLLDGEENSAALAPMRRIAEERGLQLLFPLNDLEDQSKLRLADLWGNFADPILDASRRYDANSVLVGRLERRSDDWRGRWSLYQGRERQDWEASADSRGELLAGAAAHFADMIARQYAPGGSGGSGSTELEVVGVVELRDYLRASSYLRSLSMVQYLSPLLADGDRVVFELDLRGSRRGLEQTIALGSVLVPAPGTSATEARGTVYRVAYPGGRSMVRDSVEDPLEGVEGQPVPAESPGNAPVTPVLEPDAIPAPRLDAEQAGA